MISDILSAIATALSTRFGCPIFVDDLPQGFSVPCFFLVPLAPAFSPRPNGLISYKIPIDVEYFGKNNSKMLTMTEELTDCLGALSLADGSALRGTHRHYERSEDVLHCFVTYEVTISDKKCDREMMDGLKTNLFTQKRSGQRLRW